MEHERNESLIHKSIVDNSNTGIVHSVQSSAQSGKSLFLLVLKSDSFLRMITCSNRLRKFIFDLSTEKSNMFCKLPVLHSSL